MMVSIYLVPQKGRALLPQVGVRFRGLGFRGSGVGGFLNPKPYSGLGLGWIRG